MRIEDHYAGRQHPGKRSRQEDNYAFCTLTRPDGIVDRVLLVLADGMGGHSCGDMASNVAVESFIYNFGIQLAHAQLSLDGMLLSAVHAANNRINELTVHEPEQYAGMGTTLLACYVFGKNLQWVSVGDSPLFLVRDSQIVQLNEDHSGKAVLREAVLNGEISEEEAAVHPYCSLLFSALNGDEIVMIDNPAQSLELQRGDVLIAASDGILTLEAEEIRQVVVANQHATASGIATLLERAVLDYEVFRQDNVTIGVIKVDDEVAQMLGVD